VRFAGQLVRPLRRPSVIPPSAATSRGDPPPRSSRRSCSLASSTEPDHGPLAANGPACDTSSALPSGIQSATPD
jgi:hypothetical protein